MKKIFTFLLVLSMIFVMACNQDTVEQSGEAEDNENKIEIEIEKIKVYASIYPMYDFAKRIGKDRIDLELMVSPGAEPHDWEPTAKLMAKLEKADVLIYNGVQMEMWADKVIGTLDNEDLIVVEASEGIELLKFDGHHDHDHNHEDGHHDHDHDHEEGHHDHDHDHEDEHHDHDHDVHNHEDKHDKHDHEHEEEKHEEHNHVHGDYDPHIWLDPIKAIDQAENIKNALVIADEENKDFYEANFKEFADKLTALDKKFNEELKDRQIDDIVVAHAAFGYLADRYELNQIAISGLSPQEEPSAAKMAEITDLVKEHKIKYVFYETLTSPKLSEIIAGETGAKTEVLNPLEGLTQEDIEAGKDYISVMEDNLESLKKALR